MSYLYTVYAFNRENATFTVGFDGHTPYNMVAPRVNNVYLGGAPLENYIQSLHPSVEIDNAYVLSHTFDDIPSSISGGEDIQAMYEKYISSIQ